MKLDPRSLGYPIRRLRRITLCVRRDYLLTMELEGFILKMGRKMNMTPSNYYLQEDPKFDEYILAEKQGLIFGKKTKRALYNGGNIHAPWNKFLLPSQQERLQGFINDQLPKLQAQCKVDDAQNVIVDLDQDPRHRARLCCDPEGLTSSLPTLISHNCLWHCRLQRPLLAHECLLAQGSEWCPVCAGVRSPFGQRWP